MNEPSCFSLLDWKKKLNEEDKLEYSIKVCMENVLFTVPKSCSLPYSIAYKGLTQRQKPMIALKLVLFSNNGEKRLDDSIIKEDYGRR